MRQLLIALSILFASTGLTRPCFPQDAPESEEKQPGARVPTVVTEEFDLNFEGGTLDKLLSEIEKALGRKPNIVVTLEAKKAPIPPINLECTTLPDVLWVVEQLGSQEPLHKIDKLVVAPSGGRAHPLYLIERYCVKQNVPVGQIETKSLFDINFPGGTLETFLSCIEQQAGTPPNVVAQPAALSVKLPAIKLKNVSLADTIKALESMQDTTVRLRPDGVCEEFMASLFNIRNYGNVLTISESERSGRLRSYPSRVCVYQVEKCLEKYKIEDLVTAIETALKMANSASSAQVKFHAETKLLIVACTTLEVAIIRDVLDALQNTLAPRSAEGEKKPETEQH